MSNTYTPDEEQVREQYTREQPPQIGTVAEKRAEFDRFLAKVKADAWEECAESAGDMASALKSQNPYRIEGGE